MLVRGLLVAASGFLFIFAPGLPIRLLSHGGRPIVRRFVYWGMAIWLVALLPAQFFQSLLRQIARSDQAPALAGTPADYLLTLASTLLAAAFLEGILYLALRLHRRRQETANLRPSGLSLGFGVGLIAQVFTGLSLVSAGFRLAFGDTTGPTLQALAEAPIVALASGLLAMVLFRLALLVVSAALGLLLARAAEGEPRFLWLAIALGAAFNWAILALQLLLGSEQPGLMLAGRVSLVTSLVAVAYYSLAFGLAYRWLQGQIVASQSGLPPARGKGKYSVRT